MSGEPNGVAWDNGAQSADEATTLPDYVSAVETRLNAWLDGSIGDRILMRLGILTSRDVAVTILGLCLIAISTLYGNWHCPGL